MTSPTSEHPADLLTSGNPEKPGILFLHGFLGSGRDWLPVAELLQERFHCLMPDLPGHGEQRSRIQSSPIAFHNAAVGLLHAVQPLHSGRLHLCGYSMGGRMALYLSLRFREWFTSATIVSASPGLEADEARRQRQDSDGALARELARDFDAFLERWYRLPLFSTLKNHPSFKGVLAARRSGDPQALADSLCALGTGNQPQLWDELSANTLPILFCAGEKDPKFVEIGRQMVNLCPESILEIFPGCGHTLHIENPELFLDRLKTFFNKLQPS